ncbi:MAG: helix-turn-helix domain-containing protein [Elusimicrobia bacterium]|nr:helix-turn-helix domain-containing protein [Elusimicrobiota bacterium]
MAKESDLARRLAANIGELRKQRRLTQAMLAKSAGVPRSTIANIESGGGNPALSNLAALAAALRVSIEELLSPPRADCDLLRAKDIPSVERGNGSVRLYKLLPDAVPGLQMDRMEILPKGFMRGIPHVRGAKEYLACLEGSVRLTVAGHSYELSPGDILAFPGDQPHAYHNPGRLRSVSISVVATGTAA